MKPGDLVSLSESRLFRSAPHQLRRRHDPPETFRVPSDSIALVLSLEACPTYYNPEDCRVHVLVNGKLGWVYPEDGEVVNT